MDSLRPLGRGISEVIERTYQLYGDILRQPSIASVIRNTERETFSYGPHERHKLDVYRPSFSAPKPVGGKPRQIFVFAYGGGFVNGNRIVSAIPGGLVYKNIGYFFAEKFGFETIVLDYRLLEHGARFPSGGEDVGYAIKWIEDTYKTDRGGEERGVVLMGNSAGAVHITSWLFGDWFKERRESLIKGSRGVILNGIVLLGCRFDWEGTNGHLRDILLRYYGDEEAIKKNDPRGLMRKATYGRDIRTNADWPRILILFSELDPVDMIMSGRRFAEEWKNGGGNLDFAVIKGHNHISPPLALGTGIENEEVWGYKVGSWALNA